MSGSDCQFCGLHHDDDRKCKFSYETECPFGCETFGYSPDQLKRHREDKFLYHLNILYSVLSFYGFDKILNNDGDQNDESEIETDLMAEMKKDLEEMKKLKEEGNFMVKKLALKSQERKEQMKLLEEAIEESTLTSFDGTLTWIIPEPLHAERILLSPVFHTGKYGYKMKLRIVRDVDKVKIFLLIMKGVYDAVLRESFTTTVTVKYGEVKKELEKLELRDITLCRLKRNEKSEHKEEFIKEIICPRLEVIRFKIDCSDFEMSSID